MKDQNAVQVNSALHPSGVAKSSTSFGWGKGGNVTSAGWQVTLCDPIWHVSSRSGDGRPACKLLYAHFTLLLLENAGPGIGPMHAYQTPIVPKSKPQSRYLKPAVDSRRGWCSCAVTL